MVIFVRLLCEHRQLGQIDLQNKFYCKTFCPRWNLVDFLTFCQENTVWDLMQHISNSVQYLSQLNVC